MINENERNTYDHNQHNVWLDQNYYSFGENSVGHPSVALVHHRHHHPRHHVHCDAMSIVNNYCYLDSANVVMTDPNTDDSVDSLLLTLPVWRLIYTFFIFQLSTPCEHSTHKHINYFKSFCSRSTLTALDDARLNTAVNVLSMSFFFFSVSCLFFFFTDPDTHSLFLFTF